MSAFQSDIEQNASRPEMSVFPHKSSSGWKSIFNGIQQSSSNYMLKVCENYIWRERLQRDVQQMPSFHIRGKGGPLEGNVRRKNRDHRPTTTFIHQTKVANRCLIANTQHISHNQRGSWDFTAFTTGSSKYQLAGLCGRTKGVGTREYTHQYSETLLVESALW